MLADWTENDLLSHIYKVIPAADGRGGMALSGSASGRFRSAEPGASFRRMLFGEAAGTAGNHSPSGSVSGSVSGSSPVAPVISSGIEAQRS